MEKNGFGELIRKARERRGLKAYELAAEIGRQPSFISRLETGTMKETPAPDVLQLLSSKLFVSETEMLEALGYLGRPLDVDLAPDDPRRDLKALIDRVAWDDERVDTIRDILGRWYDRDLIKKKKKGKD